MYFINVLDWLGFEANKFMVDAFFRLIAKSLIVRDIHKTPFKNFSITKCDLIFKNLITYWKKYILLWFPDVTSVKTMHDAC